MPPRSYRRMLSSFLFRNPKILALLNLLDSFFSLWSVVSFVVQSYLSPTPEIARDNAFAISVIDDIDMAVSLFFALEFFKGFTLARSKRDFFMTFTTWIDCITTFPQIIIFVVRFAGSSAPIVDTAANLSFLRFFRILKILNINRVTREMTKGKPAGLIRSQINELALTVLATLFIFAGAFQMVEQIFVSDERLAASKQGDLDFANAFYFSVITVATVGYGDVVPISIYGKGLLISLLVFMFSVVSRKIATINTLMSKQSKYERASYSYSAPHVLICGSIDTVHLDTFLRELFHRDHLQPGVHMVRAVIVAPRDPDYEVLNLVAHPAFRDRIVYINGNLLDEDDMIRARAHKCDAVFLFCSQRAGSNREHEDSAVLLQSMALHAFVQKQRSTMPRIICMVHFSLSLRRFNSIMSKSNAATTPVKHHVVCLEELKPALMAQGCVNPCFTSLAYSMIRSFNVSDITQGRRQASQALRPPWQQEFIDGLDYELYSALMPPSFQGMTFAAAAVVMYQKLGVYLISVEVDGGTHLAPLAYIFSATGATVHVLASSATHAVQVSSLIPPKAVDQTQTPQDARGLFLKLQDVARRVSVAGSVTNFLRKNAEESSIPAPVADPGTDELKIKSPYWSMLRREVNVGAALRHDDSSKIFTKDSYQFLLRSELNPKFARLEAMKAFLLLDEDVPFEAARVARYEGFGHIVFCCKTKAASGSMGGTLKRFIAPLRSKSCIYVHTPVVVLADSMTADDFGPVAMYPNVFVVLGDALRIDDLRRAGLPSAKYAAVCSHFDAGASKGRSEKDACTEADNTAIFAGNLMRKLNSKCNIVVELQHSRNVKFVASTSNENFEIGAATASGTYFSFQYFHVLMCRCFYAPFSLSLLQEFLRPQPTFIDAHTRAQSLGRSAGTSIMSTIEVPKAFVGCTFGLMFKTCASIGIPIAIQRVCTAFNAAREKYIVSCPPFNLRLNHGDRVTVLSPLPPQDVEGAYETALDFKAGMQNYEGNPAEKWQRVYEGVDMKGLSGNTSSVSSEELLVQVSDFHFNRDLLIVSFSGSVVQRNSHLQSAP